MPVSYTHLLPLAYFEKRTVGEVLSRITNDVDTLGQSLNQSITQLITDVYKRQDCCRPARGGLQSSAAGQW